MATQQGPAPDDTGLAQFQIQRGAQAEATDGPVGTVEQIVVDRNTGELRALVIRAADGRSEFELPAEFVQRSTGEHVSLDLSREQIANNPRLTQPYDPNQYVPMYEGQMEPAPAATAAAHETGHPIVTDVGTDSARVVAPISPERPPTTEAPATATDAILSPDRAQPSARHSVGGEMEGDLPTTSGMGAKSTVPPSPAPPMDTAGTERDAASFNAPEQRATSGDAEAHTTTPGMYADFTAAPEAVPPSAALPTQGMTPESAGEVTVPEQQALDESQQLFHYHDIYPQQPHSPAVPAATSVVPQVGSLGDTGPLLGEIQPVSPRSGARPATGYPTPVPTPAQSSATSEEPDISSAVPVAAWLAAAGLAIGAGAGILIVRLRRRSQPTIARSTASAAQDALRRLAERAQPAGANLASSVQGAASQASESVKTARKSAGESLAANNWRARAFRGGLLLGALAGLLFAPRPGRILRAQLAQRINQVLSRTSQPTG